MGFGNSTKPIYYKEDGEQYRCCDECNEKYVITARKDKSLIMTFRKQFGIDYTEYDESINIITKKQYMSLSQNDCSYMLQYK